MVQEKKLQVLWVYTEQAHFVETLHVPVPAITAVAYKPEQGLLFYYQQAQDLAKQNDTPCLLLFEGESFTSQDTLTGYIEHPPAFTVYAQIKHAEHTELCPRLFSPLSTHEGSLQGQRFVSQKTPPQEHIPLALEASTSCVYTAAFLPTQGMAITHDLLFLKAHQHFKCLEDQKALAGFKDLMAVASSESFWGQLATVMYLKTLWESKNHQLAFEELERLRQENTALENFPALWILRAVIAQQFQAVDMAFECFDMVATLKERANFTLQHLFIEHADTTWKPLLGSAELALKEGMYLRAAGLFKQAAHYLPDHDYVLSGWLQSAFLIRRYDEVKKILARQTPLRGVSKEARQGIHLLFELREKHVDVEGLAKLVKSPDDSTTIDPFSLSIQVEIAILCLQQNQAHIARQLILQILHYQPEQVMLWHNLAYSYFAEKEYAKAEEYYRQALKVAPHYPNSQFDLAKTLVMQSRQNEAIDVLKDLLKVHPRFQEAHRALQDLEASQSEQTQSSVPDVKIPFVFAFPLQTSWQNGLDLLMKAYYEEFVPSDHVILALPVSQTEAPELVHKARQWALENFEEDLLPAVVLLEEALPLIPNYGAWVLPWRTPPHENVLNFLKTQPYPIVAPAPIGDLNTLWQVDTEAEKAWQEVSVEQLRQHMRDLLDSNREPITVQDMLSTHTVLDLEQETSPVAVATQKQHTPANARVQNAPTLGVCMIAKNEEAVIEQALQSVLKHASEVVVVDTGSTDKTLEKLSALQKDNPHLHVHHFAWCDDFSAARNAAFEHATADWVLFLDADEYVEANFIPSLRLELEQHQADAYCFRVLSVLEDGTVQKGTSLGGVPRLFPNSKDYRFEGAIHEVVYHQHHDKMRYIYPKSLPIYHVGYRPEIIKAKNKLTRDRQLMITAIQESPTARSTKRLYGILAKDYLNTGELAEAEKYLEAGLEQSHDDARVHEELFYQRQRLRVQQGELREAIAAMENYEHPNSRFFLFQGRLLAQNEQRHEAYQTLLQALSQWQLEFDDPDPLDLRPELQAILSELVEAADLLQKPEESLHYLERYLKLQTEGSEPALWKRYRQLASQVS